MKNKQEHTKGPWKIVTTKYGGANQTSIVGLDAQSVVYRMESGTGFHPERIKTNAVFIVEACNNYEALKAFNAELLAALKVTLKALSTGGADNTAEVREIARAAIAKAEGK